MEEEVFSTCLTAFYGKINVYEKGLVLCVVLYVLIINRESWMR